MFKHILVPLDGSKVGEAALPVIDKLCDKLASGTKVEITLLGVITLLRHWVVVGEASAPVHNDRYDFNDEALRPGVQVMTTSAFGASDAGKLRRRRPRELAGPQPKHRFSGAYRSCRLGSCSATIRLLCRCDTVSP